MMSAAERREKIDLIRRLPGEIEAAIKGLDDRQLDTPYREGGWTVRQVIHHLADSHMNAFVRMKLIVTEEKPTLKPYDQNAWAATMDGRSAPVASSLAMLRGLHERWSALLESLPESAFGRTAVHPERGEVTLESQLTTYANHGVKHIGHIAGLRKARGW